MREKRKPTTNVIDEQPSAKRQKDSAQNQRKAYGKEKAQERNSVEAKTIEDAKVHDGKPENETKELTPENPKRYKDQCTAFASNLGFKASCFCCHFFPFEIRFWPHAA